MFLVGRIRIAVYHGVGLRGRPAFLVEYPVIVKRFCGFGKMVASLQACSQASAADAERQVDQHAVDFSAIGELPVARMRGGEDRARRPCKQGKRKKPRLVMPRRVFAPGAAGLGVVVQFSPPRWRIILFRVGCGKLRAAFWRSAEIPHADVAGKAFFCGALLSGPGISGVSAADSCVATAAGQKLLFYRAFEALQHNRVTFLA